MTKEDDKICSHMMIRLIMKSNGIAMANVTLKTTLWIEDIYYIIRISSGEDVVPCVCLLWLGGLS